MVLHVRPLQGLSCNSIFSHPSANSAGTLSCKIWTRDPCKTNDATWTHLSQHNLTPFHGWVNVSGSVCETGQCCSLHQLGWELTLGDAKWFVQGHKTRREAGQVLCSGSRCCLFPMPVSRVREKNYWKLSCSSSSHLHWAKRNWSVWAWKHTSLPRAELGSPERTKKTNISNSCCSWRLLLQEFDL